MRIAVVSDSHDHIVHLRRAVTVAHQEGADLLIHCGDLISPFMLPLLDAFPGPVHLIYGNNSGDQELIFSRCKTVFSRLHHHGLRAALTVGPLRIALEHYPEWAFTLARSGDFDLVCYGHDHRFHVERIGSCLLVNPGELMGKEGAPSLALVDTNDFSVRRIEVGEQLSRGD